VRQMPLTEEKQATKYTQSAKQMEDLCIPIESKVANTRTVRRSHLPIAPSCNTKCRGCIILQLTVNTSSFRLSACNVVFPKGSILIGCKLLSNFTTHVNDIADK
jgi:hypothetical protein